MGERWKKLKLDRKLLLFTVIGVFIGITFFAGTATTLKATDTGDFCSNCHIMGTTYDNFMSSNHASLACNDCHLPNDNIFVKLPYKAKAGMSHMYMNTLGVDKIPKVIHAKDSSQEVVNKNCINCHEPGLQNINHDSKENCIDCHRQVPHNSGDFRPAEWYEPKKFHFADPNK